MSKTVKYFMEVCGSVAWKIDAVLVGCDNCGKRMRTSDLGIASDWRVSHHQEVHGKDRSDTRYIYDKPEPDEDRKGKWKHAPMRDQLVGLLDGEWMTAADISESTGRPKYELYQAMWRLVQEGYLEVRKKSGKPKEYSAVKA